MSALINASTSSGLVVSPDNSGTLELQSNGVTKATISSAGFSSSGQVIQVVTGTTNTQVTNSTSTYADVGLSASITPKFSTSKILVITNVQGIFKSEGNSANRVNMQLSRSGTTLDTAGAVLFSNGTTFYFRATFGHSYYDAPATTSSITYKWQFMNAENVASVAVQKDGNSGLSQIILMEIAA
jgi:hypothetical protein